MEAVLSTTEIDIDQACMNGLTPLMISSGKGDPHAVKILLNIGANTSITTDDGKLLCTLQLLVSEDTLS